MIVFTDEWIEKIRLRYERQPEYQRPPIYFYATLDSQHQLVRQSNGIMRASSARSALSAGLWVERIEPGRYKLHVLYNVKSAHPLPTSALIGEQAITGDIDFPD